MFGLVWFGRLVPFRSCRETGSSPYLRRSSRGIQWIEGPKIWNIVFYLTRAVLRVSFDTSQICRTPFLTILIISSFVHCSNRSVSCSGRIPDITGEEQLKWSSSWVITKSRAIKDYQLKELIDVLKLHKNHKLFHLVYNRNQHAQRQALCQLSLNSQRLLLQLQLVSPAIPRFTWDMTRYYDDLDNHIESGKSECTTYEI